MSHIAARQAGYAPDLNPIEMRYRGKTWRTSAQDLRGANTALGQGMARVRQCR